MIKNIAIVFMVLVFAGCSAPLASSSDANAATLTFVVSPEPQPDNRQGGIFQINGHDVPVSSRFIVAMRPGYHRISYLCKGSMYVDGYPAIWSRFKVSTRYQISCIDGSVRIAPAGA